MPWWRSCGMADPSQGCGASPRTFVRSEEVRLRALKQLVADEDVDLLVVEGDHAGNGQELPGGKVVGPRQVLMHRIADLYRPVAAGYALVGARGHGVGGGQVLEADIGPADVVPRRQACLEHHHR